MIARRTKAAKRARAMALWQAMRVRHRSVGHVRFDLPAALRTDEASWAFRTELARVEGVYRVHVFTGAGKLSIRFMEDVCALSTLVTALSALVASLAEGVESTGPVPGAVEASPPPPSPGWLARLKEVAPVRAVRQRYDDLKAKAEVLGKIVAIKTGKPVPVGNDLQEWVIHFLNDLVAFYLIRSHWDRIIGQWLPRPWTYRYQWLSVIYLTFLLVRYRKGAVPKVVKK